MRERKHRPVIELEKVGGVTGLLLILCFLAAFLDVEYAGLFFAVSTGLGAVLNGIIALGMAKKRWFFPGALFVLIALSLVALLVIQIVMVRGA